MQFLQRRGEPIIAAKMMKKKKEKTAKANLKREIRIEKKAQNNKRPTKTFKNKAASSMEDKTAETQSSTSQGKVYALCVKKSF